jgi:phage terminase Nu1 subunit (DNA packaging protein)
MNKKRKRKTWIVSRAELAELLAVTPDSVTRYVGQGMPVLETGSGRGRPTKFDLHAALRWWVTAEGGARERLWIAQAARAEFDLQIKRGDFIARAEATNDMQMCARTTVARIRRVPAACIVAVAAAIRAQGEPAAATVMRQYVDEALRELAALGEQQEKKAS